MMPITLQHDRPAYVLAQGLRESASPSILRDAELGGWARQELLLRKLGPKGRVRVSHFRNYFASGWSENGHVLSPRALDAFFRFVESVTFPAGQPRPSVFLTDRGGVELCWEDHSGNAVQVEFTATGVEYYLAAMDQEGTVSFDGLTALSQRLSA